MIEIAFFIVTACGIFIFQVSNSHSTRHDKATKQTRGQCPHQSPDISHDTRLGNDNAGRRLKWPLEKTAMEHLIRTHEGKLVV